MKPETVNSHRSDGSVERPGPVLRALHLFALVQVAVAWPLYDLLSRFPEFFVARQSQPLDLWLLVSIISIALPALLFCIQAMASLIHRSLGWATHLAIVALLSLSLGLSMAGRVLAGSAAVAAGAVVCVLLTAAYARTRAGRLFVTYLAPAIVVVPAIFLLNGQIAPLLQPVEREAKDADPGGASDAPVIFVVFDELPTAALLTESGQINARLFPNFAALAETAHWYPNATTVATGTVLAIPPILTGRYASRFVMPHYGEYPDNLFTWLGSDYDQNVREAVSVLCPKDLCGAGRQPAASSRLSLLLLDSTAIFANIVAKGLLPGQAPVITQSWENFWGAARPGDQMYEHRLRQMLEFVESIQVTDKPGLEFMHVNFPHIPYEYLPSGKRYQEGWLMPGLDFATDAWGDIEWQVAAARDRFILQVQALDGWLGALLDRLRTLGLFERALIVITADHGVSFEPGTSRRDTPPLENLDRNILPVPLIIKAPQQTEGVISRRNAETVDILPTVAEILRRPLTWAVDGTSLLGDPKPPQKRAVYRYKELAFHETDVARIERALAESVAQAVRWDAAVPLTAGNYQALIGRDAAELPMRDNVALGGSVQDRDYFREVNLAGDFIPAHVSGVLESPDNLSQHLAVALNGRIVAMTQSYLDGDDWKFSAVLPEDGFLEGENALDLYVVSEEQGQLALAAVDSADGMPAEEWRLEGNRLSRNGEELAVDPVGIQGRIDYISRSEQSMEVFGWAIDAAERRALRVILIFDGEQLVYAGETRMLRDETHQFGVIVNVGFHAVLPVRDTVLAGTRLRVLAVTDDGRSREITGD